MSLQRLGGEWRLPKEQKTYGGELLFNDDDGILQLCLYNLSHEENFLADIPVWGQIPMIIGQLVGGAKVVLYDCETGQRKHEVGSRTILRIYAKFAFWGMKIDDVSELLFNEIQIDYGDIIEWSGMCWYEHNISENIYKWVSSPEIELSLDERTIKIWCTHSTYFGNLASQKHELEQQVFFNILPDKKWTLERFLEDIYSLRSLISLGIQGAVPIEKMEYFHECNREVHEIEGETVEHAWPSDVSSSIPKISSGKHDAQDHLFSLQDLVDNKRYINNWFNKYSKLKPVIDLCASTYLYKDISAEVFFLNMVQALETYHARFVCNDAKAYLSFVEKKVDSLYADAIENAQAVKYYLFTECQKGNKHITLKARLRFLMFVNYNYLFYTSNYRTKDFIDKVVDSRNYYTHYDASKEKKSFPRNELPMANAILWNVAQYYILIELGFDEKYCMEKIREKQKGLEFHDDIKNAAKYQIHGTTDG